MTVYRYYATVFEENNQYFITFFDIEKKSSFIYCTTFCQKYENEMYYMAKDLLITVLSVFRDEGEAYPVASPTLEAYKAVSEEGIRQALTSEDLIHRYENRFYIEIKVHEEELFCGKTNYCTQLYRLDKHELSKKRKHRKSLR